MTSVYWRRSAENAAAPRGSDRWAVGGDMTLDDRVDLDSELPAQGELSPRDRVIDLPELGPAPRETTVAEALAAADQRDAAAARRDRAARARDDAAMLRDLVALGHEEAGVAHDHRADRKAAARDRQAAFADRHFAAIDRDDAAGDRALLRMRERASNGNT
jgi:hypothetical protein